MTDLLGLVFSLFIVAAFSFSVVTFISVPRVAMHKGGSWFNWLVFAFFFLPIAAIAVHYKRPRGFWQYVNRWATEEEILASIAEQQLKRVHKS